MDIPQIDAKEIIAEIAHETNRSHSISIWQDWVYKIASTTSVDDIKRCKDILSAYFGESIESLERYCNQHFKRILPLYVTGLKKGMVSWDKLELFYSCCSDKAVHDEIEQLKTYAKDLDLLHLFLRQREHGAQLDVLLNLMRQCDSVEIKDEMMLILNEPPTEIKKGKGTPLNNKEIINKVTDVYKKELSEMLITPYNREEALRQYGLTHLK